MKNIKIVSLKSGEADDKKIVALANPQIDKVNSQYQTYIKDNSVDKYKVAEDTVKNTPEVSAFGDVPVDDFSTIAPMGDSFDSNPFAATTSQEEASPTSFELENEAKVESVPNSFDNISISTEQPGAPIVDNSFDLGNDSTQLDKFDAPVDDIEEVSLKTPEYVSDKKVKPSKPVYTYEPPKVEEHSSESEPKYSFETLDVKSQLGAVEKYVETIEKENERLTTENRRLQRDNDKYLDKNALLEAERDEATKAANSSEQARNVAQRRFDLLERKHGDLEKEYESAKEAEIKAEEAKKIAEDELAVTKEEHAETLKTLKSEHAEALETLEKENQALKIELGDLARQLNIEKAKTTDTDRLVEEATKAREKAEIELAQALKKADDATKAKEIAEDQLSRAFEKASEEIKEIKEQYETQAGLPKEPVMPVTEPKIEAELPEQRVIDIAPVEEVQQPVGMRTDYQTPNFTNIGQVEPTPIVNESVDEISKSSVAAIKVEAPVVEEPVKLENTSPLSNVSLEALAEQAVNGMANNPTTDTTSGGVTNDNFQRVKAA